MPTIGIVEDHRMTRMGIEQVLARSPRLEVIASVDTVHDLAESGLRPDVVVLDPTPYSGTSVLHVIGALSATSAVLVLSPSAEPRDLLTALKAGAYGFVTKHADDTEFLSAVEAVARGSFYLAAGLGGHLHSELSRRSPGESQGLARREVETLRLIAQGYTHGQIARLMALSEATVNTYVKRIRAKLNAGNKAELTRKAIELGYVDETGPEPAASPGPTAPAAVADPLRFGVPAQLRVHQLSGR
ncbi:LuxR C-terminal-related transcriptional regulator [Kitasatospora sp. NPDC058184]|uniref:LuxR C-terminal-related transcriptional regulator n=1 Tax=Kitasatospora sp. NPDC058184 TaxID=3346370 RepID=UPI0036DF5533